MCRSLLLQPSLLLVDEPTEGLAPAAVERVEALLREVLDGGTAVLLVEQKLAVTLDLSDRVHVLGDGRIQFSGTPAAFRAGDAVRRLWLEA
jgi:branched-chain amino acid transport system ATP-binding protein